MIHSSVYLERWSHDTDPPGKWCACDIERIECIQRDSMLTVLAMLAKACRNHCDTSECMELEMASLVAFIEEAINNTFKTPTTETPNKHLDSELPSITGRMASSHADFERACRVMLQDCYNDCCVDSRWIHILCEAVRCSRECCELSSELQALASRNLEKAKSECKRYFHHPNE